MPAAPAPDFDCDDWTVQLNRLILSVFRAQKVTSYDGYAAVLAGFANGMGDKHIWSRPTYAINRPLWPGVIVSKHGQTWVIAVKDLRAELRTKEAINASLAFALVILVMFSFAFDPTTAE